MLALHVNLGCSLLAFQDETKDNRCDRISGGLQDDFDILDLNLPEQEHPIVKGTVKTVKA